MHPAKKKWNRARLRAANETMALKRAAGLGRIVESSSVHADAVARIAEIPRDDRNLTQRAFGDPVPARSALAQRGQG